MGTTQLTDASRNREFDVYQRNPDIPPASDGGAGADSIDPTMTVIRVDAEDGKPMAVWSTSPFTPRPSVTATCCSPGTTRASRSAWPEQAIVANAQKNGHGTARGRERLDERRRRRHVADGDNRSIGGPGQSDYVPGDVGKARTSPASRIAAGIVAAWREAGKP